MPAGKLRIDLYKSPGGWRWRMWRSSSLITPPAKGYVRRAAAIRNLETITGGTFEKISSPNFPKPFGLLIRDTVSADRARIVPQAIPVRLVLEVTG